MHITKIPNVFLNIESVEHEDDNYTLSGWIHSKDSKSIEGLFIGGEELNIKWSDRSDVSEYFSTDNPNNSGFTFTIPGYYIKETIQLRFSKESEILDVINLYRLIVSKSGFDRDSKDLIVVDNFYAAPDQVRDFAMNNLEYAPSGYHKGERSTSKYILDGTKERLENILGKTITNWNHGGYANGVFQFCTADQPIVYHVDQQMYAGMVYLTPDAPPQTGTSMYRSKVTGISSFSGQDSRMGQEYLDTFKGSNNEMNFYDGTQFEKIDDVGNVYNRLVIFNSSQIHAATEYFGDAIDNARFFHMFFFDVE